MPTFFHVRLSSGICTALLMTAPVIAQADSEGPLSAGAGTNDASYGIASWSTPSNITASDGSESTAFAGETDVPTNYLIADDFGFSVPSGNTIDGVVFESQNTEHCQPSYEHRIRLVKEGVIGSTDRSTGAYWGIGSYTTYGSSTDLWGTTLAYTNVNASTFGVALAAISGGNSCMAIDHVRATVYYTSGAPVPEFSTWALIALAGAGVVVLKKEGYLNQFEGKSM